MADPRIESRSLSAPTDPSVARGLAPVDPLPVPSSRALALYLVRHGRTRFNAEQRIQGWSDSELTADGLAGVEATARALRSVPFSAAYASPSGRTLATASAILAHHAAIGLARCEGLRELHFGDDEERLESEAFAERDPREVFTGVFTGQGPGFPGGEGGREYLGRVARAFLGIERSHGPGQSVLVVSHGVTLMTYLLLGTEAAVRPPANASVSIVEIHEDGRRTLRTLGHDPSGVASQPPPVPLQPSALRLEDVVTWGTHPA